MPKKSKTVLKVEIFLIDRRRMEYKIVKNDCMQIHVYGYKAAIKKVREYFRDSCENLKAVGEVMEG